MSEKISVPGILGIFHPWTTETKNDSCCGCTSQLSGFAALTGSSIGIESGVIISFVKNNTFVSQIIVTSFHTHRHTDTQTHTQTQF